MEQARAAGDAAAKTQQYAVSQLKEVETGRLGLIVRLVNLTTCGLALAIAGVWHLIEIVTCSCEVEAGEPIEVCTCLDFFEGMSNFFIALYIIPLSFIPLAFELTRGQTSGWLRTWLEMRFGFIFLFNQRYKYLIFLGMLICGNCAHDYGGERSDIVVPTLLVGVLVLCDATFHILVRCSHPEFDGECRSH